MVSTCAFGGVFISMLGSSFTSIGLGAKPHSESGAVLTRLNFMDSVVIRRPSVLVRPMIQTQGVGASICVKLAGTAPRQPRCVMRKFAACVPVIRQLGEAKT
jgi:hypothetical protein